jgi:hypothetical protein
LRRLHKDLQKLVLPKEIEFGILDHYVKTSFGVDVFVPMRIVQNGNGSKVIFTVFQTTDMSEEKFAEERWID